MCYAFELLDEHVMNLSPLYTASNNMVSTIGVCADYNL